jgi:hypothetical protein
MRKLDGAARRKSSRTESNGAAARPSEASEEVAAYLADMSIQLAGLAAQAKLDRLGYLLTLAALEAQLAIGK